jgi:CrcB protein
MPSRQLVALVALGAAIGSSARHSVSWLLPVAVSTDIPYATLTVNLVGALSIGVCAALPSIMESEKRRTFLVTGVLGGFTTFSAFAVETVQLQAHPLHAVSYVALTFIGAVVATLIGTLVRRSS